MFPKNQASKLVGIFLFLTFTLNLTSGSSIFPGAYWTDTSGVPIQAHGGGFLVHSGAFYWFGEDKTENSHNFRHVNAYRSVDLLKWEFLSHALTATEESAPDSEIGRDAVVERPKVIYNARNKEFVMWFHLDSSDYGLAKLGVATSKTVEGPYSYSGSIAPFGEDSRDMTVWVDEDDPDKAAYLVYATRVNLDTGIARLSNDYLNVTERLVKLEGIHREAYAVFKTNGLYYIVMSRATGWDPNPNEFMVSWSMAGPWSQGVEIAPGSPNTYESQANYVIPLPNGKFIYCGDRWNRYSLDDSRYMWLPIDFSNSSISISWKDSWTVDVTTGEFRTSASKTYEVTSDSVKLIGDAKLVPCTGCSEGTSVGYIGLGGKLRFESLNAGSNGEFSILVSYANGDSNPRYLSVDVNGVTQRSNVTFPSTENGQSTKQLVFQAQLLQGMQNSIEFYNDLAYGPDIDYVKIECSNNPC